MSIHQCVGCLVLCHVDAVVTVDDEAPAGGSHQVLMAPVNGTCQVFLMMIQRSRGIWIPDGRVQADVSVALIRTLRRRH